MQYYCKCGMNVIVAPRQARWSDERALLTRAINECGSCKPVITTVRVNGMRFRIDSEGNQVALPTIKREKARRGRPRLSDEERAARAAAKPVVDPDAPKRGRGRPKLSDEEKAKRYAIAHPYGPGKRGRPRKELTYNTPV